MFGGLGRLKQFAEQAVVLAHETVQHAENAIDRVAESVPLVAGNTTTTTAASTTTTTTAATPSTPLTPTSSSSSSGLQSKTDPSTFVLPPIPPEDDITTSSQSTTDHPSASLVTATATSSSTTDSLSTTVALVPTAITPPASPKSGSSQATPPKIYFSNDVVDLNNTTSIPTNQSQQTLYEDQTPRLPTTPKSQPLQSQQTDNNTPNHTDDNKKNSPVVIKIHETQTPRAAASGNNIIVPTTPSNSANVSEELKEVVLRAEKAEAVARKLQRVVKIRELQLEKQALESSELQVSNTNLSKVVEKLTNEITTFEKEKKQQSQQIEQLQQQIRDVLNERNQLRRVKDQTDGSIGLLVAKDEQIAAVLKEGEILSKKQGLQVESIRRLRKDLADREKEKEEIKSSLTLSQSRVESLEEQLKQAQNNEIKRADTIIAQTAQIEQLNLNLAEMQTTLKAAEGAIAEHKGMVDSQIVRTSEKDKLIEKLNDETRALEQERDEFARRLKEVRESASGTHVREDALLHNVTELQAMMSVKSSEYHGQIVGLKDQVRQLQDKYRAAEVRCEELMSAIPEATRPLLRQIQSLQATMDERAAVWGEVESNWRKRLRESELALASAKAEKESLVEQSQAHEVVLAERDTKLALLRERCASMETKLESSQKRVQELESNVQSLLKQVGQLELDLEEVSKELHASTAKAKKCEDTIAALQADLQDERAAKDQLQRRLAHENIPIVPMPALPVATPSHSMDSLSTLLGGDNSMSSVETLRALVRQKDGELSCLRSQLRALEASMLQMQEQLVVGENKSRNLEAELQKSVETTKKLKALSLRHAAALQLIGEKDEQLQDLQADLDHVKQMFQQQIQHLQKN